MEEKIGAGTEHETIRQLKAPVVSKQIELWWSCVG